MTTENERQAALIKVNISSYVGTATLALIAGAVGLYTYVQQTFTPTPWFSLIMLFAVLTLVLSFILGGRGANTTAEQVAGDTWTAQTKVVQFDHQAILTMAGLVLIIASAALGTTTSPRSAPKDPCLPVLSIELSRPQANVDQIRRDLANCEATLPG
jgi:hypothetical protein